MNALLPAWRHEPHGPIAYFVDDAPLKQGTLCPGLGLPVLPPDALDDEPTALLIVIGAWTMRERSCAGSKSGAPISSARIST